MQKDKGVKFPKSFLWGASTSAHQVEGGNSNQWSAWEKDNSASLAAQAEYGLSHFDNWDDIKRCAKKSGNYISGKASNHYSMYKQDFDILEKLNMNAFRFSIEWSRIEPSEGVWDAKEIAHYRKYIRELKKRKIEPIVTLFHFSLPQWFCDKGGFARRSNVAYFVNFVDKIMNEFGSSIRIFITINEPNIYARQSYLNGVWPPQVTSRLEYLKVLNNLSLAHKKSAKLIKRSKPRAKVSVSYNSSYYYAGDDAWLTRLSTNIMQYFADDFFLGRVNRHCDFLGVNYYFSNRVYGYRVHNPDDEISDLGWDIAPENIQFCLERLHRKYKKPILITENGIADNSDDKRKIWILETVRAMKNAIAEDVEIMGYLHWSLLDNFEWSYGMWPKFGLVEVDSDSYDRTVKSSAKSFARLIKSIRGSK